MSTLQAVPQLSFQINNLEPINSQSVENTIYITTDPTVNKLTLVITTNVDANFTPSQLVPQSQADNASGSLLYLDLTRLNLTAQQLSALTITATNWDFTTYSDTNQVIAMTPTQNITLIAGTGNSIEIQINDLVLSNPPSGSSVQLFVTAYQVQNITPGKIGIPTNFLVSLQVPPNANTQDLHQALSLSLLQNYIGNSIAAYPQLINSLQLSFSPGEHPTTILATQDTAFTVTFVYATDSNGFGALTTPSLATDISFEAEINAQNWTITSNSNQQSPAWLLQPPAGEPILGSGIHATVGFLIGKIITNFQPGPTLMLVTYTGVPGYQDGFYAILLQKVPHVDIKSLAITPNPSILSDGQAQVTLNWTVYDAGTLTLMPLYQDVTGQTSCTATITDTTQFTLEAQGQQLDNNGNIAFKSVVADVLPVINSFTAVPAAIYYKDFPRNALLSWNVNTNETIQLTSSTTGKDPNQYNPVGSVGKSISSPQMLTLSPLEESSDLLLQRSIVLSAFQIQQENTPSSSVATFVAAAPNAGFIVATNTAQNQLTILDTLGYQPMGNPVVTGDHPQGVAFSPDGSLIYVANTGDGSVSVIRVAITSSNPPYSFSKVATVQVGGKPQQITVSPDGHYVYVTVDNGSSSSGSLVVVENKENNQFSQLMSINVGTSPRGVAVTPSGAQIFVANSGDDSISVIGVSGSGQFSLANTLQHLDSQPTGLAVTPDGAFLLVACSGSNTVFGIDIDFSATAPRKNCSVGNAPQQIAMTPGGAYAFVTNQGDGTVSLLSYDLSSHDLTVLEQNIQVGAQPNGIVVSPEGGLVIVANQGQPNLSILTLAEYAEQMQPVAVGAVPTNVAVAPDGSQVFVWHDSTLTVNSTTPSTGFSVYETASQTVTAQLQGNKIIECVFSPVPGAQTAFITLANQNAITVLNTQTYQPVQTLPLPVRPAGIARHPFNLAISADGTKLFTVVANGQQQYSLVVFNVDSENNEYELVADIVLFTTSVQATLLLLCASPDGSQAFAVDSVDNELWIAQEDEFGSYTMQQTPIELRGAPSAITILPDGSQVFILNKAGMTNSVSVVDTSNLQVKTVFLPEQIMFVSINKIVAAPDGSRLFATDGIVSGIRVLDATTLRFIQTISWISNIQAPSGIAILPDGSQIFTANINSNNIGVIQQLQPA